MNGGNREAPIEPALRELMRDIGNILGGAIDKQTAKTGERYGFALLMFAFEKTGGPGQPGSLNYISNAQREDMIAAMKEFIEANEAQIRMEKRREQREAAKRKKT